MRRLAVLALLLVGCGRVHPSVLPEVDHLGGILRVIGKDANAAHACPVSPNIAYTNAHVADLRPYDTGFPLVSYIWSDRQGREGLLAPDWVSASQDLARMHPIGSEFPQFYQIVTEAPKPGTKLHFLGYSWDSKKTAFDEKRFDVTVVRTVSGMVIYDPDGAPGSSGSCVLDDADRVVAINAWGWEVGVTDHVGLGVGLWPIAGVER